MAAKTALDAVQRVIKPGVKNSQITAVISNIAKEYGVETCQGVLTHQVILILYLVETIYHRWK